MDTAMDAPVQVERQPAPPSTFSPLSLQPIHVQNGVMPPADVPANTTSTTESSAPDRPVTSTVEDTSPGQAVPDVDAHIPDVDNSTDDNTGTTGSESSDPATSVDDTPPDSTQVQTPQETNTHNSSDDTTGQSASQEPEQDSPRSEETPSNEQDPQSEESPSNEQDPQSEEPPSNEQDPQSEEAPSNEQDPQSEETPEETPEPNNNEEKEEHAYWAEIEEDTSAPDEEELKEIEEATDEHSACDYDHWEKSCFKPLDDPEYKPSQKARITWKIKGVRGTKEKPNRAVIMCSPAAFIGGYYWRLKFFPRGNGETSSLSVYIECFKNPPEPDDEIPETEFSVLTGSPDADLSQQTPDLSIKLPATDPSTKREAEKEPSETDEADDDEVYHHHNSESSSGSKNGHPAADNQNWRVSAEIGVNLYNPDEPHTNFLLPASHQFNPHNPDWGWTHFHGPWDQIHKRQRGQRQALLRNDTLAFDAYIQIVDDPTRSLWWGPCTDEEVWDSLNLIGYRPIGDTMMNYNYEIAGLASWVMLAPVREIVQSVNVLEHLRNPNARPKPLCESLQKFLWMLRTQPWNDKHYVSAAGVLTTLRNLHESSRDVVGFWERLRRSLELELEGTDGVSRLGRMFDSQPVQGAAHLLPSECNSYVRIPATKTKSVQVGMERYLQSGAGKWSLPEVMHIDLERQVFDKHSRQWKMLYNRVQMDDELDLSGYVPESQTGKYTLYGFIVHRGQRTSGQFYSILRPGGPGTQWLGFEDNCDNRIVCMTRKKAVEAHEGVDNKKEANEKQPVDVATVVMYVRNDLVKDYLPGPLEELKLPNLLEHYFKKDEFSLELAFKETGRDKVQIEFHTLSNPPAMRSSIFDAYDLMSLSRAAGECTVLEVSPGVNFTDLRKLLAESVSEQKSQTVEAETIRFWKIGNRQLNSPQALHLETIDMGLRVDVFEQDVLRLWGHFLDEHDGPVYVQPDYVPPVVVEGEAEVAADAENGNGTEDGQRIEDVDEQRNENGERDSPMPPPPAEEPEPVIETVTEPVSEPEPAPEARDVQVPPPQEDNNDVVMSDDDAPRDLPAEVHVQEIESQTEAQTESQEQPSAVSTESEREDTPMNGVPDENDIPAEQPADNLTSADDAAIAAMIADDLEELDRIDQTSTEHTQDQAQEPPSSAAVEIPLGQPPETQTEVQAEVPVPQADEDTIMEDSQPENSNEQPAETTQVDQNGDGARSNREDSESTIDEDEVVEPPPRFPNAIGTTLQVYYFVQIFDAERQELQLAGSFLGRRSDNIKESIRKAVKWDENLSFLVWQRVEGASVMSVSGSQVFENVVPYSNEGECFVVGKNLNGNERKKLSKAGLFSTPNELVLYHWALGRRHPTRAFTGTKTVEATYGGHYYSGDFKHGQWHGHGTHISDTGATYAGDFILGNRQGQGRMEYASGDTYEGDWQQDQRHGQGTFVERKTGNKYVGGYRDGKRHGKGVSYWEVADEEMGLCQICYTEDQDALFYPCGHVCACVECARQVDSCPMCRKKAVTVVKIYKS